MANENGGWGGRAVASAVTGQTLSTLPGWLTGSLAPLIGAELAFGAGGLGTAVAVYYAFSAAGAGWSGPIADRNGAWLVMSWGLGLTALAVLAIAGLANGLAVLIGLLALAGLANGTVQPAANLALSRHVPPGRQGLAYGIKQSAIPLGTMIAGLAVPAIGLTVGWRWAFVMAGGAALLLILALPRATDRAPPVAPAPSARISMRTLLALTVMAGIASGTANAMGAFLVPSTIAVGLPAGGAGLLMAAGSAASIAVRIGGGWLADRYRFALLPVIGGQLVLGSAAYVVLAFADDWPLRTLGAVVGFGMGWGWAGLLMFALVKVSGGRAGHASGFLLAGTFVGATAGPFLFGWTAELGSWVAAWLTIAVLTAVSAVLAFLCHGMTARDTAGPPRTTCGADSGA